ncbi:MAG: hypothetical protein C0423_14145 [Methylibium sp.]|nr:hypothetical protein [Methylibium sp.]
MIRSTTQHLQKQPRHGRLHALVLAAVLLPLLLLAAFSAYLLEHRRAEYEARAERHNQQLAESVARSLSVDIARIDHGLISLVEHLETQLVAGRLRAAELNAYIRTQARLLPMAEGIRVTDEHGLVILGKNADGPRMSFGDRAWFQTQRTQPDAGMLMSSVLRSKLDSAKIISFSRRYRRLDGGFAGSVTIALHLDYFVRQLQVFDTGPHGLVALRDSELELLAMASTSQAKVKACADNACPASQELRELVFSGQTAGSYRTVSPGDGRARSYSFRQLGQAPLIALAGIDRESFMAGWRLELYTFGTFWAILLLLYGASGSTFWRLIEKNQQARQRIDLLVKLFSSSGESMIVLDERMHFVEVNPAFERETGYSAAEVVGRPVHQLNSVRMTREFLTQLQRRLADDGFWRGELWVVAKDGREYAKWTSVSAIRSAAGVISHYVATSTDISAVKRVEERMRHLAHHDSLTQLPNRTHLQGRLEQALSAVRRNGGEMAMLFIDMDRFKYINDTLGHAVGDGLLVEVARRLKALVRDSDIVARLGGDEFVLVLTGLGLNGAAAAAAVAQKVIHSLGQPYRVQGHELHSTPSIGIAMCPADGVDGEALMKSADAAMYHAKDAGRNNFQFFTPAMRQATEERQALEAGLRGAVDRGELFLHYQPQLNLSSDHIIAVEALVRWCHPVLGHLPPAKFIPVAEETGQIEVIGAWVLDEALRQLAFWRRECHPSLRVAVNVSAQQLRHGGIVDIVAQALQRHRVPGQALELELTETVAMDDPERIARLLNELRKLGVMLTIDDFGTGYSNLAYLKQLPLSCLKLDRSFVADIETDTNDAAICTGAIQLARSLGISVVAEGVESAAQLEVLRRLGCDTAQGYHISKPINQEECTRFLAAWRSRTVSIPH